MNREQFREKIVSPRLSEIDYTLIAKGKEYADAASNGNNVFYNFERAAEILNISREEALLNFMIKHLTVVIDMARGVYSSEQSAQMADEKIGDIINYLILLEGMIKENHNEH